jgi:hypothetical protein
MVKTRLKFRDFFTFNFVTFLHLIVLQTISSTLHKLLIIYVRCFILSKYLVYIVCIVYRNNVSHFRLSKPLI